MCIFWIAKIASLHQKCPWEGGEDEAHFISCEKIDENIIFLAKNVLEGEGGRDRARFRWVSVVDNFQRDIKLPRAVHNWLERASLTAHWIWHCKDRARIGGGNLLGNGTDANSAQLVRKSKFNRPLDLTLQGQGQDWRWKSFRKWNRY